jgi:hypothetical protein
MRGERGVRGEDHWYFWLVVILAVGQVPTNSPSRQNSISIKYEILSLHKSV